MYNYSKIEKQLKRSKENNNGGFLKYYDFKVGEVAYRKLLVERIASTVILTIILVAIYLSENYDVDYEPNQKFLIMGIIFIVLIAVDLEGYYRYTKFYPKLYLSYKKGKINYYDGKKLYTFKTKNIHQARISHFTRSSKWQLSISVVNNTYDVIDIDLVLYEDRETLYNLLSSNNKRI